MVEYTIANEYVLPSRGTIYAKDVNPQIKLRSMTTAEEMKRLNHTERPYASMAEIIDDCLVEKIGISAYDLSVPDFQYVLHKLRIVTYGPNYKISSTCPYCGSVNANIINLDSLKVIPLDEGAFKKYSEFTLPSCGKRIKLRMQTPRILDDITYKTKEERRKNPVATDSAYLFTLESLIDEIDGSKPEQFKLIPFIQKLNMADTNYIIKSAQKLNTIYGLDSGLYNVCNICGLDYTSNFRQTSEFFGPSID